MSTFFSSSLASNALTTDDASSKYFVLLESNVSQTFRTSVIRFSLAYSTLDLASTYELLDDEISSAKSCQKSGWYRAVLQCLQVDDAATLDSGGRYVNTWWSARLGSEFQSTVSIPRANGAIRYRIYRHLINGIFNVKRWVGNNLWPTNFVVVE